jgi:hypothetical protein
MRRCSLPFPSREYRRLSSVIRRVGKLPYLISCPQKIEHFSVPSWRSYSSPSSPPSSSKTLQKKNSPSSISSSHYLGGLSPKYFTYLIESATPYISSVLQLKLHQMTPGNGSLILKCRPELRDNTSLHGGAIVGAIDHSAGLCAWSLVNSYTKIVSTINLEINYLNPLSIDSEGLHSSSCSRSLLTASHDL